MNVSTDKNDKDPGGLGPVSMFLRRTLGTLLPPQEAKPAAKEETKEQASARRRDELEKITTDIAERIENERAISRLEVIDGERERKRQTLSDICTFRSPWGLEANLQWMADAVKSDPACAKIPGKNGLLPIMEAAKHGNVEAFKVLCTEDMQHKRVDGGPTALELAEEQARLTGDPKGHYKKIIEIARAATPPAATPTMPSRHLGATGWAMPPPGQTAKDTASIVGATPLKGAARNMKPA